MCLRLTINYKLEFVHYFPNDFLDLILDNMSMRSKYCLLIWQERLLINFSTPLPLHAFKLFWNHYRRFKVFNFYSEIYFQIFRVNHFSMRVHISTSYILKKTYLHSFNFIATIFQPLEHKCYFANLQFKFNFNFSSMIFFWKTLNNAQYSKLKRNTAVMISFCCLIESLFQFNLQSSKKFWTKMASFAFKILYFLRRNNR